MDHQRLRNIAILVTLLNNEKYSCRMGKRIRKVLDGQVNMAEASRQYIKYILEQVKDW